MKIPDCSDPGKAAQAFYAGAKLFAQVSQMNAENQCRQRQGNAPAYDEDGYQRAIEEADAAIFWQEKP